MYYLSVFQKLFKSAHDVSSTEVSASCDINLVWDILNVLFHDLCKFKPQEECEKSDGVTGYFTQSEKGLTGQCKKRTVVLYKFKELLQALKNIHSKKRCGIKKVETQKKAMLAALVNPAVTIGMDE